MKEPGIAVHATAGKPQARVVSVGTAERGLPDEAMRVGPGPVEGAVMYSKIIPLRRRHAA